MSDYQTMCDAIRAELLDNVPSLYQAKVHLYEPWDPEALTASVGELHLAIWPAGEQTETAASLALGSHLITQTYEVWVWEGAAEENERIKRDEAAAIRLFDIHNAIRDRFYIEMNQELGGAKLVWYTANYFPSAVSLVRWFRIQLRVEQVQAFAVVP